MKIFHPDETVTSCGYGGEVFEKQKDGSFEVPAGAVELLHHGFTTTAPKGAQAPAGEPAGMNVLADLAKQTKAEILAYAKATYGVDLEPTSKKDDMLEAIAALAAKAADKPAGEPAGEPQKEA